MALPSSDPLAPRQTARTGATYSRSNILEVLIGSKARANVLRILFGLTQTELYRSEIVRRSGMRDQGVDEQLRIMEAIGLVVSRPDGNRRYYRANNEHPFYVELRGLVLKSSGMKDAIAAALTHPKVAVAFVFGSVARMEERPDSDVDIMVFGEAGFREMCPFIRPLHEQLGREVNPHFYTKAEVARRLETSDHFFSRVMESPRMIVVGDENTLAAWLAEARALVPSLGG